MWPHAASSYSAPSSWSATPILSSTYFFLHDILLLRCVKILWLKKLSHKNINLVVFLPTQKFQPSVYRQATDCFLTKYCNGTHTGSTTQRVKELIPLLSAPHLATTLLVLCTSSLACIRCSSFFKALDRASWPYPETWNVVMDASCCCHHPSSNQEPFRKIPLLVFKYGCLDIATH